MTSFTVSPVDAELAPIESAEASSAFADRGFASIEACYRPTRRLVRGIGAHGLLATVQECFASHRPLVLAPDHVWLCVAQAVGQHVLENAEELRERFVAHEGQRHLDVRRDDFVPGGDNDWPAALQTFSDALREILGDDHALFVNESSTTTIVERSASQIVMMGALQRYFTYSVSSLCGIPSITLEGTSDDWARLVKRVDLLEGLGLDWWLPTLRRALEHFAKAAAGDAPEAIWRQLYKQEDASGGTYTSGWINALFPLLGDPGDSERNRLVLEPFPEHSLEGNRLREYGNGLTHAPFTWRLIDRELPMSFVAGFVGTTQDQSGALRPEIGWAIAPRAIRRRFDIHRWGAEVVVRPRAPVEPDVFTHLDRETAELDEYALSIDRALVGDLRELVGRPKLTKLKLHECSELTGLDPLRGFEGETLSITQCRNLSDVSALKDMPRLQHLELWHLPELKDWTPVAGLRLKTMSIFGRNLPEDWCGKHEGAAVAAIQKKLRRL